MVTPRPLFRWRLYRATAASRSKDAPLTQRDEIVDAIVETASPQLFRHDEYRTARWALSHRFGRRDTLRKSRW